MFTLVIGGIGLEHLIFTLGLSPLSAVERHQSEAEGFSAAEAGGPAQGLHHSLFHTWHSTSILHPGGPAGLWWL